MGEKLAYSEPNKLVGMVRTLHQISLQNLANNESLELIKHFIGKKVDFLSLSSNEDIYQNYVEPNGYHVKTMASLFVVDVCHRPAKRTKLF